jgi:hypothetical protein
LLLWKWIFDPLFFDPGVTAGSTKKLACAEARLNQLCEKIGLSALECARKNILIFCDRLLEPGLRLSQ